MPADIVIINDYAYINGGAAQVALTSAIGLAGRDFRVTVFAAVGPIMPELKSAGVEVLLTGQHDLLNDPNRIRASVQGIWNRKSARLFSERLDCLDRKKTIIHVHAWTKALSSSVIRLAIRRGFKVVVTLHDYFIACPNGGFFNYPENRICKLKGLSASCIASNCDVRSYPQKLWRVLRQFTQSSFGEIPKGVRHFVCLSDFSHKVLKEYLPEGSAVYRVPNPIETERRAPVDVKRNSAYGVVARLSKEKGVVLFAQASKELGCDALFVGDGACREEIKMINPEAKITGWVSRGEVNGYMDQMRVLAMPSLLYEVSPLAVLEAAGRGVPAIVPDACAAADMVDNKVTGLVFRSGDAQDLISKMKMLSDDKLVGALGRAAYDKFWKDPFTMDRHLDNLADVYDRILSEVR